MALSVSYSGAPIVPIVLLDSERNNAAAFTVDWTKYKIVFISLTAITSNGTVKVTVGGNDVTSGVALASNGTLATLVYDSRVDEVAGSIVGGNGLKVASNSAVAISSIGAPNLDVVAWGIAVR